MLVVTWHWLLLTRHLLLVAMHLFLVAYCFSEMLEHWRTLRLETRETPAAGFPGLAPSDLQLYLAQRPKFNKLYDLFTCTIVALELEPICIMMTKNSESWHSCMYWSGMLVEHAKHHKKLVVLYTTLVYLCANCKTTAVPSKVRPVCPKVLAMQNNVPRSAHLRLRAYCSQNQKQ